MLQLSFQEENMGNTLFIYRDAVTKKVAVTAGSVLAMSAYKAAGETADAQKYARLILVVSAGARTADYAAPVRAFAGKEIICFFVGLTKDEGTSFQAAVAGSSGKTFYISAESLTEDTLAAASALLPKKAETADPADIVIAAIQRFLHGHNTGVLATGHGDTVRATPIEYLWHDGRLWLFTEGGRKFLNIYRNRNVSFSVFDPFAGLSILAGLQIHGQAAVHVPGEDIYETIRKVKGISDKTMATMPVVLHLVEIVPEHMTFLCGAFIKEGLAVQQHICGDWTRIGNGVK